ncbi:hypothetical protein EVAR_97471_1 [Eumeta japonica]|uniref:Uncharacterized protein n=1 Tax=Eumeta variegata TaxID=151549 RepID=A0A4C2AA35_EUMVA|nr:hypothetical protein EVAR_97471_1 [Eumeta japonica]
MGPHSKAERSENYDEWAFAAENLLILEGVADCIKQERSAATAVAEDAKAKAKLILTIDPSLYVHIKEAGNDSSEAGNAFSAEGSTIVNIAMFAIRKRMTVLVAMKGRRQQISQRSAKVHVQYVVKESSLPFGHAGTRSSKPLDVIHADVCGPMEVTSIGRSSPATVTALSRAAPRPLGRAQPAVINASITVY